MSSQTQTTDSSSPPRITKRTNEAAVIAALIEAADDAESRHAYLRAALALVGSALHSPFGLLEATQQSSVINEEFDGGSSDPNFWREPLHELLTDVLAEPRPIARLFRGAEDVRIGLFAAPLLDAYGGTMGALTLAVPLSASLDAERVLSTLEAMATVVGISADAICEEETVVSSSKSAERTLKSLRQAAGQESGVELAMAIVNRLRTRDELDQVALGTVRGKRLKLLAISGLDRIQSRSPGVAALHKAMEECSDFREVLCVQEKRPDGIAVGGRMHDAWHRDTGSAAVASIPMMNGNVVSAVLTVRKSHGKQFTANELAELSELVAPYALSLELLERAGRGLVRHVVQSVATMHRSAFTLHGIVRKLTVLVAAGLFAWSVFGTMDYRLNADTELRPTEERQVGTPQDARLVSAGLLPGSFVTAGSVLCEFDSDTSRLEARRLIHEIAVLEVEESRSLAADDPGGAKLMRARMGELQAGLEIVRGTIERSIVRSPIDGTILEGDLRDRIGDSFSRGEPLFRIASGDTWTLELEISESEAAAVQVGMTGAFTSYARPEIEHPLTVRRIAPAAIEREGRNIFLVEAEVSIDEAWVKSGMEGIAYLSAGRRSPAWIALHGMVDTLRMHAPR